MFDRLTGARHLNFIVTGLLLAAILAGCGNSASLPKSISPQPMSLYPGNADPLLLVDVSWLSEQQRSNPTELIILDASNLATYVAGHIPGAIHAWWQDAMDPNAPAYGMLLMPDQNAPDPQRLRKNLLEDLGVTPESMIVVYDNVNNEHASGLVWTLRFLGYPRSALLNGGLGAWIGAGGSSETYWNAANKTRDPEVTPQQDWYLVKDQLLNRLNDPSFVIVDIRTEEQKFDGIDGTIATGKVPGSLSLPWSSLLDPNNGLILDPDSLRQRLEVAGVTPESTIVLYGRFGLESTLPWIVLKLMGYESVLLYSGGWAEWSADPNTPKVLNPSP